ncbi:hypothetical protein B0H63DRAFT_450463 [Podospora didyma]|uniref:Uncharacterized protein n=1 Tax=Podospora didyma TaxID=330526 RepID=A0AAE0NGI6_9PEZI|nr:hypothetical protein B0H63DRAFT_450463 [Podospora didyma]
MAALATNTLTSTEVMKTLWDKAYPHHPGECALASLLAPGIRIKLLGEISSAGDYPHIRYILVRFASPEDALVVQNQLAFRQTFTGLLKWLLAAANCPFASDMPELPDFMNQYFEDMVMGGGPTDKEVLLSEPGVRYIDHAGCATNKARRLHNEVLRIENENLRIKNEKSSHSIQQEESTHRNEEEESARIKEEEYWPSLGYSVVQFEKPFAHHWYRLAGRSVVQFQEPSAYHRHHLVVNGAEETRSQRGSDMC